MNFSRNEALERQAAAAGVLHDACDGLHVTRPTSHVTRHTSNVTRHTSHVTRVKVTPIPRRVLGGFSSQTPLTTSATSPSPMTSAARLDDSTASGGAKASTIRIEKCAVNVQLLFNQLRRHDPCSVSMRHLLKLSSRRPTKKKKAAAHMRPY